MNILIAGATGKTGTRLVRELGSRGHNPIALVREGSDTSSLPSDVELREGDLTDLQDGVCENCDIVIFAAGSGGDTSAEMTDKVDRDGARRLIDLAVKADVQRFVMLSSVGADNPAEGGEMEHYLQAKHDADMYLRASGLKYAIVRPVALTDADGSREIRLGTEVDEKGEAARGDVAFILANAADSESWMDVTALMESI
ncbi:SDR family oxidoreductase [Allopontixanthobacter sediminis]|uniref:NAD(P)H-binding protein n=1 Tax=Allopontixanthobacter sediminis TaxID=1689985 RepID=A0A845B0W2_9SPHN|nr:SDR family oxidoreductase [Allopontixanthobacter sediminis]MXP45373.1 NAD(P)H-binding protein [Allopontixanthobacter sediminis]